MLRVARETEQIGNIYIYMEIYYETWVFFLTFFFLLNLWRVAKVWNTENLFQQLLIGANENKLEIV